jgi:phosphopantetheine--protein transferase-like protein
MKNFDDFEKLKKLSNCVGVGIDIEEVARFRDLNNKAIKSMIKKYFTDEEIDYCYKQHDPPQHFCARYCAKEAAVKAYSQINFDLKISKEIYIETDEQGKPHLKFTTKRMKEINTAKYKPLLSMSHTKGNAIAIVAVLEVD